MCRCFVLWCVEKNNVSGLLVFICFLPVIFLHEAVHMEIAVVFVETQGNGNWVTSKGNRTIRESTSLHVHTDTPVLFFIEYIGVLVFYGMCLFTLTHMSKLVGSGMVPLLTTLIKNTHFIDEKRNRKTKLCFLFLSLCSISL